MHSTTTRVDPVRIARIAGVLYLVIIVLGLFSEGVVRAGIRVPGDAAATAANVVEGAGMLRLAFVADSVVFLSDAAVAVLFYVLFRPVSRTVALAAGAFRLTQTAVLALNLLNQHAALLVMGGAAYGVLDESQRQALAYLMLNLHEHGYDLGLLFFAVHCLLLGWLVVRSTFLPQALGWLLGGAAAAYLAGSYVRFVAPDLMATVAPVYAIAIVAELGLCGWLLIRGVDGARWETARLREERS